MEVETIDYSIDKADEYAKLNTKGKRVIILDYFFRNYIENNETFTYLKPKDLKNEYKITSNHQRTMNRHFQWLWGKYITISNIEHKSISDHSLTTEYKIRTKDDDINGNIINFNIPTDPFKRKHYATLLVSLLNDTDDVATQIPYFKETATMGMGLITKISDGVLRDVLLASKIYEYFHCEKGSLLSIIAQLSHFKQPIWIEFKDGTTIKNGVIHSIGVYEDGAIELSINNMTIEIENIDEITDIYVLSKNIPSLNVGLPKLNTQILLDSLKNQPQYGKMTEIYDEYFIDRDNPTDDSSLEEFIKRLCKRTDDKCLTLTERAQRKIKIIE